MTTGRQDSCTYPIGTGWRKLHRIRCQRPAAALFQAALIGLYALAPSAGFAQQVAEVKRFGNWEVLCGPAEAVRPQNATPEACRAIQRLTIPHTGETAFALTIVLGDKAGSVAIVSVPLGGYLVPGIEFSVDSKKPYKLLIETCTAAGCHAGFPLTGQVGKDMRAGRSASFRVWSSKSQSTDVKISLDGFAGAMADLERRS
jgi:invasion protein IalB